ncbi:MAG: hypothetical protein A2521_07915 [Deltaproteobacteria bacterium RIFOXYD12_FULL_57_12]|nr:MAG: hypothetical protein A2521_07915 [Deltaproteobacteria bacterium RIFOXYD12_FULL_57_12]
MKNLSVAAEQLSGQAQQLREMREMLRRFTLEVDGGGGRGDDLVAVGQRPNREIRKRPAPTRLLSVTNRGKPVAANHC